MSDLGRSLHIARSQAQLPVSAYFDEALWKREREVLFRNGPGYVGHELMVPQVGDYRSLAVENDGRVLVRNPGGIELLSNVCRHRQAIMLRGAGNTESIVCPLHRWTYNLSGELIGAPRFAEQPCARLAQTPLQQWQGLLFEGPRDVSRDLAKFGLRDQFDFSDYRLDHIYVHECPYNWKTFIEVYLEDYHVSPAHPGLGKFVTCDDLTWEFGDWYSVQTVGIHQQLRSPGTPIYQRWHQQVLRQSDGQVPQFGAIWMTYFPNLMLEWYPNVLVVSHLIPRGPQHTTNIVEFYYPEEIVLFEREFIDAERAAYLETCAEDDEIALRMDAGRRALYERGQSEVGPYQSPMEDGMQHFHQFLRNHLPIGHD